MADNDAPGLIDWKDPVAMERRIFHVMGALNILAVLVSAPIAPWRITSGLALGGFLAWLNHRWIRRSMAAAFGSLDHGAKPNLKITRYFLRYFVMTVVVGGAYWLDLISILATLAAMASFALAAMCEGFIQTYFIVMHKEGN